MKTHWLPVRRTAAKLASFAFVASVLVGCNGVERLINGRESEPAPTESSIIGGPTAMPTAAPTFDVPQPANTTKHVFYGELSTSGLIQIDAAAGSTVDVFILERSISQWFRIGQSGGAWHYTLAAAAGTVRIEGGSLALKGYCVYQYVPEVHP